MERITKERLNLILDALNRLASKVDPELAFTIDYSYNKQCLRRVGGNARITEYLSKKELSNHIFTLREGLYIAIDVKEVTK